MFNGFTENNCVMGEFISNLIVKYLGISIFVIIGIFAIFGIVVWKLSKFNSIIKNLKCEENTRKLDEIREKAADRRDLPCENHREIMGRHDNAVARIETSIEFLTKEIHDAMSIFQQQHIKTDGFTQTHSPLSITKQGWEMVERLGVRKMFDENWTRIKELIDNGLMDKNAYDIDDFCIKQAVVFPEKFLSNENISVLKDDAFKNGLTLTSYMKVIAVMARDEYFKVNGIKIDEMEKKEK